MSAPAPDVALCRVLLFTPGNRPDRFAKAAATGADGLILDLEDAVSLAGKDEARTILVEHFRAGHRRGLAAGQVCGLRVNNIHTAAGVRDLDALVTAGVAPDFILLPKVESAVEVRLYARHLPAIPLVCTIESARGLEAATEIANADPRVRALAFGGVDLAADLRAELAWEPLLWGRGRLVQAAATAGIAAIDVPHVVIDDEAGLRNDAARAKAMGYTAKLAIHPKQVPPILEVFTPTPAELERARGIVAACEAAGGNVVEYQGKMIDEPVVKAAQRILARAGARCSTDRRERRRVVYDAVPASDRRVRNSPLDAAAADRPRSRDRGARVIRALAFIAGLALPGVGDTQGFLSNAPYVPTPQSTVDKMLELAKVGPNDFVIDLGSGDGRIPITAAKRFGARAVGIEIEADLIEKSRFDARWAGVADRVTFKIEDLFTTDLRPATVLTLYLFRELNIQLRPRILEQMKPGSRVVTHDWDMGEWEPDVSVVSPAPDKPVGLDRNSKIFLWYIPARMEGRWRLETTLAPGRAATVTLAQTFQRFEGALEDQGARAEVAGGRARGTAVQFSVPGASPWSGAYEGTAEGDALSGEIVRERRRRRAIHRAAAMKYVRSLAAVAAFLLAPAFAAEEVPYVQTPQPVVDAMLKLAGVNGRDFLIDLGSGDGRIPITAAKRFGTRGYGVDYVGTLVKLANDNAAKAGVADRVRFEERDIFKTDVSAATVVAFYLLPDFNLELRPKLLEELKPGTRLVSHDGDMGDWPPDAKIVVDAPGKTVGVEKKSTIYLWVVPAMVMGEWKTRVPLAGGTREVTLDLAQSFQSLSGAASVRGKSIPLERAYVRGQFVFFRFPYDGGRRAVRGAGDEGSDCREGDDAGRDDPSRGGRYARSDRLAGETSEVTLAGRVACPAWLAGHGETCQLQNSRIARLFSFFGSAHAGLSISYTCGFRMSVGSV